jgi:hypothetical protein
MQGGRNYGGLGRRYFSRAPLHSHHFWLSTLLFLIVIFEAGYYSLRFASRMDSEALASMIFPALVAAVLWVRVLIAHRDVYRTYHSGGNTQGIPEDPRTEKLLNNLAYLLYAGFGLAMFALGSLYVAAAKAITEAAHR